MTRPTGRQWAGDGRQAAQEQPLQQIAPPLRVPRPVQGLPQTWIYAWRPALAHIALPGEGRRTNALHRRDFPRQAARGGVRRGGEGAGKVADLHPGPAVSGGARRTGCRAAAGRRCARAARCTLRSAPAHTRSLLPAAASARCLARLVALGVKAGVEGKPQPRCSSVAARTSCPRSPGLNGLRSGGALVHVHACTGTERQSQGFFTADGDRGLWFNKNRTACKRARLDWWPRMETGCWTRQRQGGVRALKMQLALSLEIATSIEL